MADELMFIKKTTLTDIGNSVRQKLGTSGSIKVTELSQKILEIPTGGGSGDLIDVETFPTTNVQDDKVYRAEVETNATYDIYMYDSTSGTASSLGKEAISGGITLNYYEMNSTAEVASPIATNPDIDSIWSIYIEKPTGIAYIYYSVIWVTFGGMLSGDPTNTSFDKGYTTDPNLITVDGIYVYKIGSEILTGIGIPNANGDKLAFIWNGTEWRKDNIVRVETLPETGETDKLYEIKRNVVEVADMAQYDGDGKWFTYKQFATAFGGSITFYTVTELPEKGTYIDNQNVNAYCVIKNGEVVEWAMSKSDGSLEIQDLPTDTQLYSSTGQIQNPVAGEWYFLSNEYTKYEYYGYSNGQWQLLSIPQGTLVVTENGITDCAGYEKVDVRSNLVKRIVNGSITKIEKTDISGDIRSYAFAGCTKLTEVELPQSSYEILSYAFYKCTALTKIYIPCETDFIDGLIQNHIGNYAFSGCTALTSIVFSGTKEQWKQIIEDSLHTGSGWNENTGNYVVTCTDGTIAKDGTET